MANGPKLSALNATIDGVSINNESLALTPHIAGYKGEPMYITGVSQPVNGIVTITISNDGPPTSMLPPQAPAKARFVVTFEQAPSSTAGPTTNDVPFNGKPLVLTGKPTPSVAGVDKWDGSTLVLNVEEWRAVPPRNTGVVYVIRHDSGAARGQMWWLMNPDDSNISDPEKTGSFIENPVGAGVHGPFGLETP